MSKSAAGTIDHPGKNVKQKSGLNCAILRQGWSKLKRQLKYKAQWRGGYVFEQSETYTSQECPKCSHTAKVNRVSQAKFVCENCGCKAHADLVGASNQLKKFLNTEEGAALLASGYRASGNSLWSVANAAEKSAVGVAAKQEPIEGFGA